MINSSVFRVGRGRDTNDFKVRKKKVVILQCYELSVAQIVLYTLLHSVLTMNLEFLLQELVPSNLFQVKLLRSLLVAMIQVKTMFAISKVYSFHYIGFSQRVL